MKVKKKCGNVKVICGCQGIKEVSTNDLYQKGGLECKACGQSFAAIPAMRPQTHKSSKERHKGHSGASKPERKSKEDKQKERKNKPNAA